MPDSEVFEQAEVDVGGEERDEIGDEEKHEVGADDGLEFEYAEDE